jgi:hypothetical protein
MSQYYQYLLNRQYILQIDSSVYRDLLYNLFSCGKLTADNSDCNRKLNDANYKPRSEAKPLVIIIIVTIISGR